MAGMQPGSVSAGSVAQPATMQKPRRRWWRWPAVLVACGMIVYLLTPPILRSAGQWLDVGEDLKAPVDYVYVLGGEASTRPFLAAAIYRAGYASTVLLPETKPLPADDGEEIEPHHSLMGAVLLSRGVPDSAIICLPGPVDSTEDEARALAKFLESNPNLTVAVVTSNFHTRRTRLVFRRILTENRSQLHFISCPTDGFGAENWWKYKEGVLWYSLEFAKLAREGFQYWSS